ncbi:hypothetical protein LINPERHAP2_LOCUS7961 [Linum perenne]
MAELTPNPPRRFETPSSECPSCRRDAEEDHLSRYLSTLSLPWNTNRRPSTIPALPPLPAVPQMLKTAAVNPSLPCGCRPGLNGAVLGPRKVLAAGSEPFHEVHNHIRKPQSGTTASNYPELGILQKQRVVQNRVSPFLGPGFGLPRSSTGSGTGVFHPRVENTEATAPDAAKTNLREFSVHEISHHHHVRQIPDRFLSASVISGKHRRRERVQVAAADQVEGKPSMEESGGEEEEEEDCYYHLPPEIDLLIR